MLAEHSTVVALKKEGRIRVILAVVHASRADPYGP